jgi:ATP-binding cassette subfamily F protein uup
MLVNAHNLELNLASRLIFKNLSFGIEKGEKIGLIGPNGAGKSSLMKIIAGIMHSDSGQLSKKQGLKIAYLEQSPVLSGDKTILETLLESTDDPYDWQNISQAYELLSKFGFAQAGLTEETLCKSLSGGWAKKAAFCRELLKKPELLLLDEPTNHLDVESILWLEEFLSQNQNFSTLTITHDRLFLNRISNRIWELDRRNPNGLLKVTGDYADYCDVKSQQIAQQEKIQDTLQNVLRRETEWLRRGPKARTTKQQARIDRAENLSNELSNMEEITRQQKVGLSFESSSDTPKKLIEAKNISKSYLEKSVFHNFSLRLERGQRIGLLGVNGAGKSTLIKVLLGVETPSSGSVEHSERLQVAYFAQNRDQLDPKLSVLKSICPQGDHVKFRGQFIHIRSYLDRFLFSPLQMESVVAKLSGGEQARLLLARLMLTDANLLVLDEPTNDLDLQTLNILEEQLRDFDGALILVTHDRYFLDQVTDRIFAIDNGDIKEFYGVEQWENWFKNKNTSVKDKSDVGAKNNKSTANVVSQKLTFNEQQELLQMEKNIHSQEERLQELHNLMQSSVDSKSLLNHSQEMAILEKNIEQLYARWQELEKRSKST